VDGKGCFGEGNRRDGQEEYMLDIEVDVCVQGNY
jgi:hypothetical protein